MQDDIQFTTYVICHVSRCVVVMMYDDPRTYLLHFCLVFGSRDERDGKPLGAETAGTTHTVQILVGLVMPGG